VSPDDASVALPLTDQEVLALRGPGLSAEDRDILAGFAAQLATALGSERLQVERAEADALKRSDELRSALLAAVSHDLRTPLASIKAASSSLLSDQLEFGPEETRILLQTIDDESDRLSILVENLLDMSRIQSGSMETSEDTVAVAEVIASAIDSLGPRAAGITSTVPDSLPRIHTDAVLLERVVANLVDNALVHAEGSGLAVEAGEVAGRVDIRVVDRGPGIRPEHRDMAFEPFQRLGDNEQRVGVGLGLAVARGFVQTIDGELDIEDTPGGGCTMVIRLPAPAADHGTHGPAAGGTHGSGTEAAGDAGLLPGDAA
jgi:two-component system sensor histidine kinase KdpD